VLAVALLHVVPMRSFADKLEKTMAGWLHDEVSISTLKFSLLPSPHLKLEGIVVGKLLDAKASTGRVFLDISTLFGDRLSINTLELDNVSITGDAPRRILTWAKPEGKNVAGEIDVIRLKSVKLDVKPEIAPFDATLSFAKDGAFRGATLSGEGKWNAKIAPRDGAFGVDFSARHWQLPMGASIPVSEVIAKGTLTASELVFPEFEADTMEGKVNGTLKASWAPEVVRMSSDLSLQKVRAEQFVRAFTPSIAVNGKLEGNFSLSAEARSLATLFAAPRVQGKFKVTEGSISNTDLVAAMQSAEAMGRAGVTKFAELSGEMSAGEGRISYRNVALLGGVLRANGGIDIGANGALSGRIGVEIRSNVAQDRGSFAVTGTVAKPLLKRGG
jgi:uncharacterized protein involved in outer membrane biogenesis